jgi:hypothetical protein
MITQINIKFIDVFTVRAATQKYLYSKLLPPVVKMSSQIQQLLHIKSKLFGRIQHLYLPTGIFVFFNGLK